MNEQIKQKAWGYIQEHQQDMVDFWQRLVQIESGSANKAGVDCVAETIAAELTRSGASAAVVPMEHAGNMVVSTWGTSTEAPVVLVGHMDTVFADGTVAARPFTIRDGLAYGPGVLDMKGGLVIALYAIKALQAAGYTARPIKTIFAGDEETGHVQSDAAHQIMAQAKGAVAAFNCETGFPDNGLVVQRKGSAVFKLTVAGVGAHAGNNPKDGRSAILEMAHKIIAIQALTDYDRGTTFNVGTIQGGTVVNAVPDSATIAIDVRYIHPEDIDDIVEKLQKIAATQVVPDTTATLERVMGFAPMKKTEETVALYQLVESTYQEMGLAKPHDMIVGGGSDSAYTVLAGVPTVCAMGVKGKFNHTPREYADVESLFERAKVLIACIVNVT